MAGEDPWEFARMSEDYYNEFRPQGPVERTLFDELVAAAWKLRRARLLEAEACAGTECYSEALARHHARVERTFHLCLKELKARRNGRSHQKALLFIDRRRQAA